MCTKNIQNMLQSCAVPLFNGYVFEIIDELLLWSCVFKFMQNQFHVDIQNIWKGLQQNQEFLFVNYFERFFQVRFH